MAKNDHSDSVIYQSVPLDLKLPVKIKIEPQDNYFEAIKTNTPVSLDSGLAQNNAIKIESEEPQNSDYFRSEVKKEYSSGEDDCTVKTLVLRFKRDKTGNYSVIPMIKPDPFFEEQIDDVSEGENSNYSETRQVQAGPAEYFQTDRPIKLEDEHSSTDEENNKSYDDFIKCKLCSYTHTVANVKKHFNRVHVQRKISCQFCTKRTFKERDSLDAHLLKEHSDSADAIAMIKRKIWKCRVCVYKTISKCNFTRHLVTHEDKLKNDNLKSLVRSDIRNAVEKRIKYNCHHCSYGAYDKGSIIKHVRIHKGKNYMPHKCTACNLTFNEVKSLHAHIIKRHCDDKDIISTIKNKIIKCEYCNYRDVSKSKVLRHKSARHVKKEQRNRKIENE